MKASYKYLFFDLDRTLWDFDSSAKLAFEEIFRKNDLIGIGIPSVKIFQNTYNRHNEKLWAEYREGRLKKEILRGLRFRLTLQEFGVEDDSLAEKIGQEYVKISPLMVSLFPYAAEILEYLNKQYELHLITNGFSEVQYVKLESSGLGKFFKTVTTSEEAGVKKPNPGIFDYAIKLAGANLNESLMIGDDLEVDILGARDYGMDQVFFDPHKKFHQNGSTFYINSLKELEGIL